MAKDVATEIRDDNGISIFFLSFLLFLLVAPLSKLSQNFSDPFDLWIGTLTIPAQAPHSHIRVRYRSTTHPSSAAYVSCVWNPDYEDSDK